MRRLKIVVFTLFVLLAASATAAGTASAEHLTLSTGGTALAPGAPLELISEEGGISVGGVTCNGPPSSEADLHTILETNSQIADKLQGGSVRGGYIIDCPHSSFVHLQGVRSPITLRASGIATAHGADLVLDMPNHNPSLECHYSANHLEGTNTATPSRQKLEISLGGTLLLRAARLSEERKACPLELSLDVSFSMVEGENFELVEEQVLKPGS